jgi:hypothetical protein
VDFYTRKHGKLVKRTFWSVPADFARELERDLAARDAELAALREQVEKSLNAVAELDQIKQHVIPTYSLRLSAATERADALRRNADGAMTECAAFTSECIHQMQVKLGYRSQPDVADALKAKMADKFTDILHRHLSAQREGGK